MPKITLAKEKLELEVAAGANLREECRKAGVSVYNGMEQYLNCQGFGLCGTCLVFVKQGMENLSPKTLREKFNFAAHPKSMMLTIDHEKEARLSCQVVVNGDCTIETRPEMNWSGEVFWKTEYPNK